jgi:hypothetical protein
MPPTTSSVQQSTEQSTNQSTKSEIPQLWVSDPKTIKLVLPWFEVVSPSDEPAPGAHYIATDEEADARALYYRIKAIDPNANIYLLPLDEPFNIWLYRQENLLEATVCNSWPYEKWNRDRNEKQLSIIEAKIIVEALLTQPLSSIERTIEFESLRKRCGMSGFDWNKFIANLEAEIHAAVDGQANDPDQRLQLELQALLKEIDPIKFIRKKQSLSQRYGIRSRDIDFLLKHLDQATNQPKPRCLTFADLLSQPQTGIDYLIPGMLPKGECVLLVAPPKAGKSLLAYDAAFAVATGEDTFLGEIAAQGKVLVIQTDESMSSATARLIKRGFREEDADNLRFMDNVTLSQYLAIEAVLEEFRPDLVILDCLKSLTNGLGISENSAEFADIIYKFKQLLSRYNCAGILIHHTNKNQDALGVEKVRGSSAIAGAVWGVWELGHIPKPDPNNKKKLIIDPKDPTRILNISARDVEGQRIKIELDPENNHWLNLGEEGVDQSEAANRKTHEEKILALLQQVAPKGLEGCEIKDRLDLGRNVYQHLSRLLGKGLIGSRPSAADKRRTVYFYPTPCDSTPPSPPLCVPICDLSAETLTQSELEIDHKIDHKLITNGSQELQVDSPVSNLNADQASVSEIDHNVTPQRGGEGVKCDSLPSNNDPLVGKTVRYIGSNAMYKAAFGRQDATVVKIFHRDRCKDNDEFIVKAANGIDYAVLRYALAVVH